MVKRLSNGAIYRATCLESIPLAAEMFEKGTLYPVELLPADFTTFVDLGCNVGYFACWLADLAKGKKLSGLMADANPAAVDEAKWHMKANGLSEVVALNGVVGEGPDGLNAEFYLYDSNICSTSHLTPDLRAKLDGRWEKISVPCLEIGQKWKQRFGQSRCNILKIDVEGSEFNFLKSERDFLVQCDVIFIEWHKWAGDFTKINELLEDAGLRNVRIIEESETMGTACFRRVED